MTDNGTPAGFQGGKGGNAARRGTQGRAYAGGRVIRARRARLRIGEADLDPAIPEDAREKAGWP